MQSSKTELMKLQSNKIGKKKLQMSGTRLLKRNRQYNHAQNWQMTLIFKVKFHSVSISNLLITCPLESGLSKASKMSYSQRVSEAKKKEAS